ncbi:hypothetical protein MRBLRH13_001459 [Agrobacterium radiobacter]|uniref:hypothetical protein n=1 Tax=Agrobacterium radiobacter TaxID=362 RepID=UPI00341D8E57
MKIFISVGLPFTEEQEKFVSAVEQRLTSEGFEPKTVGRNTFGSQQPLKAIEKLMDECVGVVVIALERKYIELGIDKRGSSSSEVTLKRVRLPTPWVQVEAGMAYARGLPLLVIAEKGILEEGLIAEGYDWFIQRIEPLPVSLSTAEFSGILSDWKDRVRGKNTRKVRTAELSIGDLLKGLTPAQLWKTAGAILVLACFIFSIGVAFNNWYAPASEQAPRQSTALETPTTGAP